MRDDTIFALSTARGRAAIGVVRVSGPGAGPALDRLAGRRPEPRGLRLAGLRRPSGEIIDRALVLWFEGPASETGEDMAEFHVHGGPAVIASLLEALAAVPGCRMAEPGEFTRRAFENGKLDLSQAEGIADLVAAETEAQRRQALRQSDGAFAKLVEGWAARLTGALARLEAAIDFADEELPSDLAARARGEAEAVGAEIAAHLADGHRGELVRGGLSVAITGPPNSGKSSLLNALAGRDAAIVSATAGTTRDVIEVQLDLAGYQVVLADTAGLRDSDDPVEAEGIARARARAAAADLVLRVEPAATAGPAAPDARTIRVLNKIDLLDHRPGPAPGTVLVSVLTAEGLPDLVAALAARAESLLAGPPPIVTRVRHRAALEDCRASLVRLSSAGEAALAAEDLRLALRALGRITGPVGVDDLLDLIFGEFCIGK
ncbi:MAG TPA: tRNA uridine-5-carboxymethylaminomethyl(34) synthesis GTPase MnmE [Stellaceae bacterium]|nr:tRNA uridine-5-carboxymethylaminomethyl(34) synthesis GTPase MnmE [Stellaceae bacterium]